MCRFRLCCIRFSMGFRKIHRRFSCQEVISLPVRTLLKTLMPNDDLEVDGVLGFMPGMVIDGVQIVEPDMFSSEKYVVHGISRAFKMDELFTA
ncbi:hypothetical protein RJT34_06061 [Clitoria ternatea]|uniref:Uncharacterized protein n=1 Tax=Clitoria ternatea TaxID=43366 RepID=A0AAN9K303_CLITE